MFDSKEDFMSLGNSKAHLKQYREKALSMLDPETQARIRMNDGNRNRDEESANGRHHYDMGGSVNEAPPQEQEYNSNQTTLAPATNNFMQSTQQAQTQSQPMMSATQNTNITPKY